MVGWSGPGGICYGFARYFCSLDLVKPFNGRKPANILSTHLRRTVKVALFFDRIKKAIAKKPSQNFWKILVNMGCVSISMKSQISDRF